MTDTHPATAGGWNIVLITGLSGAGKSTAMRAFEDLGHYCIDNLPPELIPDFFSLFRKSQMSDKAVVIASDVRSGALFSDFDQVVQRLRDEGLRVFVLYLDCDTDVLVHRFKEVRRTHPLEGVFSIEEAIAEEKRRLAPIVALATTVIDTSRLSVSAFRRELLRLFAAHSGEAPLTLRLVSFGFKYGVPRDVDFVFDVRFLPNPYYVRELQSLTGLDDAVYDYVFSHEEADAYFQRLCGLLDTTFAGFAGVGKHTITVGIGCTGGQHRSVAFVRALTAYYDQKGVHCIPVHRELASP